MGGEVFSVEGHVGQVESKHSKNSSCTGCGWWGGRHTLALMLSLGLMLRVTQSNMSIAIVAMAGNNSASHNTTGHNDTKATADVCPPRNQSGSVEEDPASSMQGEFPWTEPQQGLVLGAYYYGYCATNLLGGRMAEYLGGKLVFGMMIMTSSVLNLFGPLCARTSFGLFVASRVAIGLVQGVTFPSLNALMASWYPQKEKAKFSPFIYSGMEAGGVIASALGGVLSSSDFLGGWPSVFYVFGASGLVWVVPWFLLVHDRPENHPRISKEELQHIQSDPDTLKSAEVASIPWLSILTSPAVWSCFIIGWGSNFGYTILYVAMPTYLVAIQQLPLDSTGLWTAAASLAMILAAIAWGLLMDFLSDKDLLSITAVRKLSTSIATLIPAVMVLALAFVRCDATLALTIMYVATIAGSTVSSGFYLAEQDIAPNLSATLLGITNTIGAATGFAAPAIVGALTDGKQKSLSAWRTVFIFTSVNYVVTTIIYLFTMSAKVQPWAKVEKEKEIEITRF